jgi:peptidyl-prolyl cis-trans isomerase B (cyclophilin B)
VTIGHLADLIFVRALSSADYHVVLAAARSLKGAPVRDSVVPALFDALERISKENRQTSRDPRLELLSRIREMGDAQSGSRLQPFLADVDPAVAAEAASVLGQLTGRHALATTIPAPKSASALPSGVILVRVTMSTASGSGVFDIALDANRAPLTVARVRELIRNRYYDGLTFHRVVPNFVLQGGSPGMNEYVGDGPFLRDELDLVHHDRYSLGISTRGRDTGDAQWFINLVDNYRLDHEYTVIGRIMNGFDVVDRILEGDTMESVRIVPN